MWQALSTSQAAASGLLEDLEDTVLFVENIGHDRISDITTNIVRGPLVEFTQDAAGFYGIPLKKNVATGRTWNSSLLKWETSYADLPVLSSGPLLLVPKCVVRRRPTFDPAEYIDHYILPILQEEELQAGSALVEVLRNGTHRVTKKAVAKKYGRSKKVAREVTTDHPDALQQYRIEADRRREPPSHEVLAAALEIDPPDWEGLLAAVVDVPTGKADADAYHRAVQALLGALFYPSLVNPQREFKIHDGRKRIDITLTNEAPRGTFWWVHEKVVQAPYVFVECKNYGKELSNPEVDQLAGRFSPHRGKFGILCHRGFGDRALLQKRCIDTAKDDRGFIVTLDDDDLRELVNLRKSDPASWNYPLLKAQLESLLAA